MRKDIPKLGPIQKREEKQRNTIMQMVGVVMVVEVVVQEIVVGLATVVVPVLPEKKFHPATALEEERWSRYSITNYIP